MNFIKSMAIAALTAAVLLPSMVSCSSGDENVNIGAVPSADSTVTEAEISETLQSDVKDMGGMELRILNYDPESLTTSIFITNADEMNGEPINDAIYTRNRSVESNYNVLILEERQGSNAEETLKAAVLAGDDNYDLAEIMDTKIVNLYIDGIISPIDKLSNIDLSQKWWVKEINDVFNLYGTQIAAVSDFCLSVYTRAHGLAINKVLLKQYDASYDPYSIVRDGNWTYDEMFGLCRKFVKDLDGNGEFNELDQYGITSSIKVLFGALYSGSGERFVDSNENGDLYFSVPSSNRAISILEKLFEYYSEQNVFYKAASGNTIGLNQYEIFEDGQVLIIGIPLKQIDRFRNMEQDIGILPIPKYEASQEKYYSTTSSVIVTALPMSVPSDRYENIGILLESLSHQSHDTVRNAYYDVVLKGKYSRDVESEDMVDIIFGSMTCDIGITMWVSKTRDRYMTDVFLAENNVISSTTEKIASEMDSMISELTESIKSKSK